MTKKPFFSIIIPTLNEESFLPKLLLDLSRQSYQFFEILVVDGQSADKTLENALKFRNKLNLLTFNSLTPGVANQRNFGAKQAKGQYLIFFDADNRLPTNFLSELNKQIKKQPGYLYITKLATKSHSETQISLIELTNFIIEILNTLGKPLSPGCNIIVEKGLFKRIGGFNPLLKLAEDHDIAKKARKHGIILKILKTPILYVSLRRLEKLGYLHVITQYALSGLYILTETPITKELYHYPLGGEIYKNKSPKPKNILNKFKSIKKDLKKALKTIEFPFQ